MSNGIASSALQNLLDTDGLRGARKLGPFRQGLIIASAWSGTIIGTVATSGVPTARLSLLASAVLQCLGGLVSYFAPTLPVLIAGRLLCGLGNGLVTAALNTYTGEIAPPPVRGGTIALQETTFLVGAMSGALAGRAWLHTKEGWRRDWGLSFPLGLLAFLVLLQLPDTPRAIFRRIAAQARRPGAPVGSDGGSGGTANLEWDEMLAEARAEAERALCHLRGLDEPDEALRAEVAEIEASYAEGPAAGAAPRDVSVAEIFTTPARRQLLLASAVAISGPALCGHSAFEGYGTQIFHSLGYGTSTSADLMIGLFGIRLLTTLPDFLWLDTFGRRTLMSAGLAGICGSYGVAVAGRAGGRKAVAATAVLLSSGFYQAAVAPLSWIVPTELFPTDMRLKGGSLSSMAYAALVQAVLQLHPLLAQRGVVPFLVTYMGTTIVAFVLNRALLPETVGRSLEDIERDALAGHLWRRASMQPTRALLGMGGGGGEPRVEEVQELPSPRSEAATAASSGGQ